MIIKFIVEFFNLLRLVIIVVSLAVVLVLAPMSLLIITENPWWLLAWALQWIVLAAGYNTYKMYKNK